MVLVKAGSFVKNTGTGNQSITGVGFQPESIIFFTSSGTSSGSWVDSFIANFGAFTNSGTWARAVGARIGDNVAAGAASAMGWNFQNSGEIYGQADITSGSIEALGVWSSADSDGFTINWSVNTSPASIIHYLAFAGGDIQIKGVSWQKPTSTGNYSNTAVGFRPEALLFFGGSGGVTEDYTVVGNHADYNIGAADYLGNQWAVNGNSGDQNTNPLRTIRSFETNHCFVGRRTSGSAVFIADFVSMDTNGFTINYTTTDATARWAFAIAIRGIGVRVGNTTKPTGAAPASNAVTTPGLTPKAVLFAHANMVAGVDTAHQRFGLGVATVDYSGSSVFVSEDNVANSNSAAIEHTNRVMVKANNTGGSTEAEATLTSLDTTGFTLSWNPNDAVAMAYGYIAFGDSPSTIAENVILPWPSTAASIPSGWTRETTMDGRFPKGTSTGVNPGTTAGSATHTHTTTHTHSGDHTHTVPNSPAGSGTTSRDTGTTNPPEAHTHNSNPNTVNPTATTASDNTASSSVNNEPQYFEVIFVKSSGTPKGAPNGILGLWNSAPEPHQWRLADGNNGTVNVTNRFLKGAAAAGNGGGTGGATTHSGHTISSHTHGGNYSHNHPDVTSSTTGASMVAGSITGANAGTATSGHTHALTIGTQATAAITGNTDSTNNSANNDPVNKVVGVIQNTGTTNLPNGLIALWLGTLATIPTRWALCDGSMSTPDLRDYYPKAATSLGSLGSTGGSNTHTHTVTGHTHAIASHDHTVTAAAGAGENRTAGSTGAATTAHTHPSWSNTGASSLTSGSGGAVDSASNEPANITVAFIMSLFSITDVSDRGIAGAGSMFNPATSLSRSYLGR